MPISKTALHLLALPLLGAASLAQAATVDPSLFQQLQWRSVGPFRGGRVLAVTATADTLADARARAYAGVARIDFAGAQFRTDIAARAAVGSSPAGLRDT